MLLRNQVQYIFTINYCENNLGSNINIHSCHNCCDSDNSDSDNNT